LSAMCKEHVLSANYTGAKKNGNVIFPCPKWLAA